MAIKKITRRWLLNSFVVIVIIIVLLELAFAISISNYFYSSVRQYLSACTSDAVAVFQQDSEDPSITDLSAQVQAYVESFAQHNEKVELMTLNEDGAVELTSSGFMPDDRTDVPDYERALADPNAGGYHVGKLNDQRIMAYTILLPEEMRQSNLSAIRVVTALDNVDRQVFALVLVLLVLGVVVLAMVLFSSSYFISSIVNPIGEIGKTARRIAQGDFAARLPKKTDDEIGELCEMINYMAGELSTAEQLKNDFISSVSHELRTPLTAIQGWAETLRTDDGNDKEILRKGMGVIIGETGRLSQMVEELLDFSRMQSGRLRLVMSKMDAMAELSEAALMYTERARRENIALDWPDPELIAPVYGDRNKLRQVFVNVIDNAIKYSNSGGIVRIRAAIEDDSLVVVIADNGIGIREEDLTQVKQKFYKADSTRRGSGIGLAVADEIITRHEGTLEVASRYGEGTSVTITLPLYRGQEDAMDVLHSTPPQQ